jgi:apolipoprotein N-acyltransferase
MEKVALLFAGQGAQYIGMGRDLYEAFPESRVVFDQADKVLGFSLSRLCFEGPQEKLAQTQNCQPAILVASIAAWEAFKSVVSRQSSVVSKIKKSLLFVLLVTIALSYGYYKLNYPLSAIRYPLFKISVIQGNIPQELKWNPQANDYILDKYFRITLEAAKVKPDLIIWPEAALPVVLEEEPTYYEIVKDFVREIKIPLLLGAVTTRDSFYYNSALLVSDEGELLTRYDKLHLVPFGEYIPLKKILGFLGTVAPIGDFTAGKEYAIFKIPNPKSQIPNEFSVLICFEDLFPEISREFVKKGADFLVNITNDAWFKKTSSPYQHLQASVFRAVENRVPVVRAANTGISGFIAPTGKIISLVSDASGNNIFVSGYKNDEIFVLKPDFSFYSRYGDIFVFACLLFILYSITIFRKKA